MSARSLGYVDETTGHIPGPERKEYISCPLAVTFLPGLPSQVRSASANDTSPLWDHYRGEHGPQDPFGGALCCAPSPADS